MEAGRVLQHDIGILDVPIGGGPLRKSLTSDTIGGVVTGRPWATVSIPAFTNACTS